MSTLFGLSRLRARALNCSSVNWGKGRAEAEAIINIMRDKEAILIQEIQIRATMETRKKLDKTDYAE